MSTLTHFHNHFFMSSDNRLREYVNSVHYNSRRNVNFRFNFINRSVALHCDKISNENTDNVDYFTLGRRHYWFLPVNCGTALYVVGCRKISNNLMIIIKFCERVKIDLMRNFGVMTDSFVKLAPVSRSLVLKTNTRSLR